METHIEPDDYRAGIELLVQQYQLERSELRSARGISAAQRGDLLKSLTRDFFLRCEQERQAISDQMRADRRVVMTQRTSE
jgi:hypothetical protein